MRNKLIGLANKSATEQHRVNASLRMTKTLHAKQSRQLSDQNEYAKKWNATIIVVNNAYKSDTKESNDLKHKIGKWRDIATNLEQQYLDVIHDMSPENIYKVWVKNEGKKGEFL